MEEKTAVPEIHIKSYRTYVYVWVALLLLLAATIYVAKVNFTSFSVVINLFIATLKAGLVLAFFMHLKYEGRFLKGMLLLALGALTCIIALTFSDVWYR
jgi:cytochrome c oxidase subunit IV